MYNCSIKILHTDFQMFYLMFELCILSVTVCAQSTCVRNEGSLDQAQQERPDRAVRQLPEGAVTEAEPGGRRSQGIQSGGRSHYCKSGTVHKVTPQLLFMK